MRSDSPTRKATEEVMHINYEEPAKADSQKTSPWPA